MNGRTLWAGHLLSAVAAASAVPDAARGADDAWSLCGAGFQMPARPVSEAMEPGGDPEAVELAADEVELVEDGVSVFTGDVRMERGRQQLRTDELTYTSDSETFDARGNVELWDEGVYITGERARAESATAAVSLDPASYMFEDRHGHGAAAVLTHFGREGNERTTAEDATYTTCNPDGADWRLSADHVEFDHVEETGTARNMWLEFKGLPVFYTPWISFPLGDRRKSGFLAPTYGVSGSRGLELKTPYYFNLAPNYDATLTARAMSDRGVQAMGEFRFLSRTIGSGRFTTEYLPSDAEFGDDRAAFDFAHRHRWSKRWSTDTRVEWASDAEYFEDLGTGPSQTSRTSLPRRIDANYRGEGWRARLRLRDYLTVDRSIRPENRPYANLPELFVRTTLPEGNRALNFSATGELAYFDHPACTTGVRMDLRPSLTYPLRTSGTFLLPKATLHFTRYALDRAGADAISACGEASSMDDAPSRLVPSFRLDGGVLFERPFTWRDRSLIHTIEPRFYYLHVPFVRQDDLPDFDASRFSFSFGQLFREDRFAGRDRVGDADQMTLALTSRLLDKRGGELGRASIGQIRYFRDREVTLNPTDKPETASSSDVVAEAEARLARRWRLRAGLQHDPDSGRTVKNTLSVRYHPREHSVLNATYRLVRDIRPDDTIHPDNTIEQVDLSFAWPIGAHWRAVGRWNLALDPQDKASGEERNKTLEAFGGLEYESCCWGLRAVVRRFLSGGGDGGDSYSTGFFLQLELKGLTSVGHLTGAFLERNIPGYENAF